MKKDLTKILINEIYSKALRKKNETNKIILNHIDETWSIDLADLIDYKISNNKGFRYIVITIDNFSKHLWARLLKNKYSQTITNEFSNMLTTSKRKPLKIESERGTEFYNNLFQNFLNFNNIHHYSHCTDKCPSIAERNIRTVRSLVKKNQYSRMEELIGYLNYHLSLNKIIIQFTIALKRLPFKLLRKQMRN